MKFIIATKNAKKLAEMKRILTPLGIEAFSEAELGISLNDVPETGSTFEENAELKALAAFERSGLPAIADDSGLCVDALGGAPGVFSARYSDGHIGSDPSKSKDERNTEKLLYMMRDISDEKRTARFVCVISIVISRDKRMLFRGECEGKIAHTPKGTGGFGYDPVFITEQGCFAEIPDAEKDKLSHRGKALRKAEEYIQESVVRNQGLGGCGRSEVSAPRMNSI